MKLILMISGIISANIHKLRKEYDKALENYDLALGAFKKIDLRFRYDFCPMNKASVYALQGRLNACNQNVRFLSYPYL